MKKDKTLQWGNSKLLLWLSVLLFGITVDGYAQGAPVKKNKAAAMRKAVNYSQPIGSQQVGNTNIYYKYTTNDPAAGSQYGSIEIYGKFGSYYYGSTYNEAGYRLAMQVENNPVVGVNCSEGTTNNGVKVTTSVEAQGELAKIIYSVTNTNTSDVTVSLGIHADVQIGDNDDAPITRYKNAAGNTYGLAMKDGRGAQFVALFGMGLAGVTGADDFWFGYWSALSSASEMVGNYYVIDYWMQENGSYDSGMGWCWKGRLIPAGQTVKYSYLIGIGDVDAEQQVMENTFSVRYDDSTDNPTDDLINWNDLSLPHRFKVGGYYANALGQGGYVEYAVEGSEVWRAVNANPIASGTDFTEYFNVTFDPARPVHEIRFRIRDNAGNINDLPSSSWADISFYPVGGIQDYEYTGNPIYQTDLTYDFGDLEWTSRYTDNVNVGTAHYIVEGVYPNSIGRSDYPFSIYTNDEPWTGVTLYTTDDNSETLDDNDGETNEVKIQGLTMSPYTWNTLCVPFNATMEQIREALGEDADVEELVRSTYDEETLLLTLYFTPRTEIVAGMPYVVKVATDIVNPVFKGVTISNVTPETIYTTYSSMTGDYNPTLLTAGDLNTLFISNNHFYFPSTAGPLPGTKCWFTLLGEAKQDKGDESYSVKGVNLAFDNEETTGILDLQTVAQTETDDNAWYTLQGSRVTAPQRGIYIRNGKKVLVK